MAPDRQKHRDQRSKIAEETGDSSTSSTTPSASRLNGQPEPSIVLHEPLSTSSHFNNTHPFAAPDPVSTRGTNHGLNHDAMDYSASKDKEVALAFRGRRNVLEPIDEDAEMEDAASSPVDRKHDEGHSGESDHEKKEEGKADFSASKGKGRAPSPPNRSETEVSQGAGGTSNREAQDVNMEDHDDKEANQEDRDHEENSRERDPRDDRSTDGPGSLGRYTHCVQIPQVMPVNPPVQELRLREDGTWDIRPARRE